MSEAHLYRPRFHGTARLKKAQHGSEKRQNKAKTNPKQFRRGAKANRFADQVADVTRPTDPAFDFIDEYSRTQHPFDLD